MREQIQRAAEMLAAATKVAALTGAGVSVESGIPAFRGSQGLWEKYDPMDFASIESFRADPGRVWGMLAELDGVISGARPNAAHLAMARLEAMGKLHTLVTQNIDGLHQAAGSARVVEFHGNGAQFRCLSCHGLFERDQVDFRALPPRCQCGGLIKPDVVFFGEPIPERQAMEAFNAAQNCQAMLVVGTSAVVAPASMLPGLAKRHGAKIIEVNMEPTGLTGNLADISLMGGAGQIMPELAEAVARLLDA